IAIKQSCFRWVVIRFPFLEAGHENTAVILALNEKMDGIAISMEATHDQLPVAIGQSHRFEEALASAAGSFLPGGGGVFHLQSDRFHTVAMFGDVVRDGIVRAQRCS